ncbi:MAG: hypothetical protein GY749_24870 [Desulfobacteraceae bacterium]|nr:hypothetical protein [Desulfobacteraceae bacterium]
MELEQEPTEMKGLENILKLFQKYKKHKVDYMTILDNIADSEKNLPIVILTLLVKFSNKSISHTDKQAVKNYFKSDKNIIDNNNADYVFAILGLYYGYENMIKNDDIRFSDTYFQKISYNRTNIKSKLDSYLDRLIIESVFQFCLNNRSTVSDSFDYLKAEVSELNEYSCSIPSDYTDYSYTVFGKRILKLKKTTKVDLLAEYINKNYGDFITHNDYLFAYIKKYLFPELLSKQRVLEAIKNNPYNMNELERILTLDKNIKSELET